MATFQVINGTQHPIAGFPRARIDGRLTYGFNGQERCAWIGNPDDMTNPAWRQRFDRDRLAEFAEAIEPDTRLLVLDVEHYPTEQLGQLGVMAEVIRKHAPAVKIGVWSTVPVSAYFVLADWAAYLDQKAGRPHNSQPPEWWELPQNGPAARAAYFAWRTENELRARILGPHLDCVVPSIYPVVEPPPEKLWMGAREPQMMLAECRRLFPRLPCYPCWQPHLPGGKVKASPGYARTVFSAVRASDAAGMLVWTDRHVTQAEAAAVLDDARATDENADTGGAP